jgi:hypothetical protein
MSQVGATPPAPPPTTSSAGTEGTSWRKLRKKKKFHVPSVSAYEGKCEEIKHHVYDVVLGKNSFDVFAKMTTKIGEYIAWTIPNAGEFTLVMRPNELGFPVIPAPPLPTVRNDLIELEIWQIATKCYNNLLEKREENKRRAHAIVWGQCSLTIQDCVKASATYQQVSTDLDLIELLQLIWTSMYTGATSKDTAHALIDAMERFHAFKQSGCMDNATYLWTFQSLIEAIDHLGGGFGIHVPYIQTKIQNACGDPDNVVLWSQTEDEVKEEFIAKYILLKSDPKCYAGLIASNQNDYISGQDKYPRTLSKAYDMIVNYVNPHKQAGVDLQEQGMSFFQDDDDEHQEYKDEVEVVESQGVGADGVVEAVVLVDAYVMEHKQTVMRRTTTMLMRSMNKL